MIYAPTPGQRVSINYARKRLPHQGKAATVLVFNRRAKGPRNVLVRTDDGTEIVVPRGNLVAAARRAGGEDRDA